MKNAPTTFKAICEFCVIIGFLLFVVDDDDEGIFPDLQAYGSQYLSIK